MPRLGRSSVDIEVSTDSEVSRITGEHIVEQLFARQSRIVIEDEQLWLCLPRKLSKLRCRCVILGGKLLEGPRPRRQPRWCVHFVNQHVAATARIDRLLRWVGVARDDDTAIRRIEAVAVTFHSVLRG